MQIPQRAVGPARGYRESLPRVQLPPLRHELFERLFAGVQRRELAAPLEQPQMGAEVECILRCVEVTAAALAVHVSKPNAVGPVRGAVAPLAVADLYTRDGLWSAGAQITHSESSGGGTVDGYMPTQAAATALSLTGRRAPVGLSERADASRAGWLQGRSPVAGGATLSCRGRFARASSHASTSSGR